MSERCCKHAPGPVPANADAGHAHPIAFGVATLCGDVAAQADDKWLMSRNLKNCH
ncbi:MAG: hypothetical protein M3O62_01750 [Pseudomonadota bacterium]|nr:hypothetical protein [Pseudomonadota bacterium]